MNRQERRKQEKISKKENDALSLEMPIDLLQPWSVPLMRTKLPPYVLDRMIEISDDMISDEKSISHGARLAGQIKTELTVDTELLKKNDLDKFFHAMIKQFVIFAKIQQSPYNVETIRKETWLSQMLSMWVVSQKTGEYNPIHFHTECQISAVMYLKVPKFLPSEKEHRQHDDGSITFISNASLDKDFSHPNMTIRPVVADFFIFGSNQLHSVNPYWCEEGDSERRSVSFNANFMSQTDYYNEQKKKELLEGQS
jgi:uncharacterized protein (TIGR02466 family)|tara:strand:- start:588 stop:1349 length:762 start_codon:yes stop_codon:yes gene_type:complete